jgi:hypothetical protein
LNILCGHQYSCPNLSFLLHSGAVTIYLIVHFIFHKMPRRENGATHHNGQQ